MDEDSEERDEELWNFYFCPDCERRYAVPEERGGDDPLLCPYCGNNDLFRFAPLYRFEMADWGEIGSEG